MRQVGCVPRDQDVDGRWADQGQPDEEQEREDREQEGERERQEGLRPYQGLDRRRDQGAQGLEREGLRRGEEGRPCTRRRRSSTATERRMGEDARSGMWGLPASCLSDERLSLVWRPDQCVRLLK